MANNWSSSYSTLKKNLDKKCEYMYIYIIYIFISVIMYRLEQVWMYVI